MSSYMAYLYTPDRSIYKWKKYRDDPDIIGEATKEDYEDQFHTWRNYAVGNLAPYFISGGDRDNDGTNAANGDDDYAQTVYEINCFGNMAPQHHDNFTLRPIKAHHGARSAGKRLQTVAGRDAGH
jgi:endonuclease G